VRATVSVSVAPSRNGFGTGTESAYSASPGPSGAGGSAAVVSAVGFRMNRPLFWSLAMTVPLAKNG